MPTTSRRLFMPKESGAWGALIETILAGLLVAFNWRAAGVALALVALFFLRQPIRLLLLRHLRGRDVQQRGLIAALVLGWSLAAALLLLPTVMLRPDSLIPFGILALLGGYQLWQDVHGRGRTFLPEVAGAIGMTACCIAILLATGHDWPAGLTLWGLLVIRHILAIMYIRFRLRATRGAAPSPLPLLAMLLVTGVVTVVAVLFNWLYWLAAAAVILVILRVVLAMPHADRPVRPAALGMRELALGIVVAVMAGIGMR